MPFLTKWNTIMFFHPEVMGVDTLAKKVRKVPNFPKKGILFHDITPVLQSPEYFRLTVDLLTYRYMGQKIDMVAGLDARGFIIGAALAYQLNVGFVPIRKQGKLPFDTISQTYALEYGEATVEIHKDCNQIRGTCVDCGRFGGDRRHNAGWSRIDSATRR